jgi:hypothetical protein
MPAARPMMQDRLTRASAVPASQPRARTRYSTDSGARWLVGTLMSLVALCPGEPLAAKPYPLTPQSLCGATQTCAAVLDRWNNASWRDLVDEDFDTGSHNLAAVRWYNTEGACSGSHCNQQLHNGLDDPNNPNSVNRCPVLNTDNHQFCGVTDELSNVLLSLAMGSDRVHYEKLRNFTELLRDHAVHDLQCWKYYVNTQKDYNSYSDLCVFADVDADSAADASLRILGAYAIACAKQRSGLWAGGSADYCADYLKQGNAIWAVGMGPADHGEVKRLSNLQYYLAASFRNQPGSPTAAVSFRPDYYELQFLMDFAWYRRSSVMVQGVLDMLGDYAVAMGTNHIHRGKNGHFDSDTTTYTCDEGPISCDHPYMDNVDTWRAIPALSGLLNVHPEVVPSGLRSAIFDYWWQHFSGGHPTLYGALAPKPSEIFANQADGDVKQASDTYQTLPMWVPLASAYDPQYVTQAVRHLVDDLYRPATEHFDLAAYYGGYYSQFAQRALGAATGMIDPGFWAGLSLYTISPCRAFDSRLNPPVLSSGVQRTAPIVQSGCPVPTSAVVVAANVTVTSATGTGYLVMWPAYVGKPSTSVINFTAGRTVANNAMLGLDDQGALLIEPFVTGGGTVQVIIDVSGYFQ